MEHARSTAKLSTCTRALKYGGIGAVIVVDGREVAQGYAGSMRGDDHCTDVGCSIDEKTSGCDRTVHAEMNAVLNAAYHGVRVEGGTLYCTASPCWACFRALRNAGITAVYYAEEYRLGVERQKEYAKKFAIVFAQMEG
ncbi:MAG: deaminase [bacterium]|nr:deaminase [bacterium]